jgi:hypothetical protein
VGKPSIRLTRAAWLHGVARPTGRCGFGPAENCGLPAERLLYRGEGRYPVWVGVMPQTLTSQRAQPGAVKMRGGILRPGLQCGSRRGVDLKECGAWTC